MIQKLHHKKHLIDVYDFVLNCKDVYQDFYITSNKERKFLTDLKLIEKILKHHIVIGIFDGNLKALLIIYKEKGFRAYVKILSEKRDYVYDLLSFLLWNYNKLELYIKLKKENPISRIIQYRKYGFKFCGSRGREILLIRNKEKKYDNNHRKSA